MFSNIFSTFDPLYLPNTRTAVLVPGFLSRSTATRGHCLLEAKQQTKDTTGTSKMQFENSF